MSPQSNAAVCRAFVERVYSEGRLDLVGELVAEGAIDHGLGSDLPQDANAVRRIASLLASYRQAVPDLQVEILDMAAAADRVVTLWRMTGTSAGAPEDGIAGRPLEVIGIRIDRLADGKIVESWGNWDTLRRFERAGALPDGRRALDQAA